MRRTGLLQCLSILLAAMMWACTLRAGDDVKLRSVSVSGMVVDEHNAALVGVSIVVEGTYRGTTTDAGGHYRLNVPQGQHTLCYSFIGYKQQCHELACRADTIVNVVLTSQTVMLDDVIIADTRSAANDPLTTSELHRNQLIDNNISASLPYMLELQPSMVSTGENGTQLGNTSFRLRGTDASRINVNINGIPLNDPESQAVFWVNLPNLAGMAESVQVQRGMGASTGGVSAFGGAVNVQTQTAMHKPYARMDLSYGSFNTMQSSAHAGSGLTKHGFSVDAGFTKLTSDGYIRNGSCNHLSAFLNAERHGKKSLIKAIVILGKQKTGITWNGTPAYILDSDPTYNDAGLYYDDAGNVRYYDNETDNYRQNHFQLYYSLAASKKWTLNAAADYTRGYGYYENYKYNKSLADKYGLHDVVVDGVTHAKSDLIVRKILDNDLFVTNLSLRYKHNGLSLSLGGMLTYFYNEHYGNILWSKYNDGTIPENYRWYYNDSHKNDATSFAKIDWQPCRRFKLYSDIQYRYVHYVMDGVDDDFGLVDQRHYYNFFNPKVGFTVELTTYQRLSFLSGLVNREPTRADLKDALKYGGREIPKPETMLDLELGYAYNPARWKVSVNVYFMGYKDQLVSSGRLNDAGYVLMENVDKSYRLGVELAGGVDILSWLKAEANVTISRNKVIDYIFYRDWYDNPTDYNPLGQRPLAMGNTNLAFSPSVVNAFVLTIEPLKNLRVQFTEKYVGSQNYDNTSRSETRLDDYCVLNGKVSYLWKIAAGSEIEFQFLVNNMLNHRFSNNAWGYSTFFQTGETTVDSYYFPQPGINFMGRIILKF